MLRPLLETTIEEHGSHREMLSKRRQDQLAEGSLGAEHRYQDTALHTLTSYNSPLNFIHANNELLILEKNRRHLAPLIEGHHQWHWGTGVGETEGEIARWQMENAKELNIIGVDMNAEFLSHFRNLLISKSIDLKCKKVRACFMHTLFQNAKLCDAYGEEIPSEPILQVCVGGVVGSFQDQSEIWSIFKGQAREGDKLIVGTQLNTHLDETFEKYTIHPHIPKMALGSDVTIDPNRITWNLHPETSAVTMTYDDPQVGLHGAFYHKKFTIDEIEGLGAEHGFEMMRNRTDEYRNSCIALFEYRDH